MKKAIKFIVFFIVPILLFILWLGGFFSSKIEPGEVEVSKKTVTGLPTMKVSTVKLPELYQADGMVMSNDNGKVATKVMAEIVRINVKEGDRVKKGQVLAVLDDSDIQQQKKQALAGLEELKKARLEALAGKRAAEQGYKFAKKTYERFKNLYLQNSISKQQFEEIETKMIGAKSQYEMVLAKLKQLDAKEKQVKAQLNLLNIMLSWTLIKAPFDGYVLKKLKDVGDMVPPGYPVFVIGNKELVYYSQLDESLLRWVHLGQEVTVYIVNVGRTIRGKIIELNPNIDPQNRSFSIKVALPRIEGLSSGMYGVLNLSIEGREKIIIPKSALVEWNQLKAVYKVGADNILHLSYVKLGDDYGNEVEVISGLEDGDIIVVGDVERACDGCKLGG